jgi:hypothetical protein
VRLAGQWNAIERTLPESWSEARLQLTVSDPTRADRAAALLGPTQPYRSEPQVLRFSSSRRGHAPGPDGIRRLLRRLDGERIRGTLELVSSGAVPAAPPVERPAVEASTLVESWDEAIAELPADWSDVHAEVELLSTDYLERAALLMAPMNPLREGATSTLRFRAARAFGYGASPQMVRRCLERCDGAGIRGSVRVLRVLCDTDPVGTQGPVWYVGGRTV